MRTILSPTELRRLENEHHASGISARDVLDVFQTRGIALSEGTFRKYVQAGLLPRSRRVGARGRNRGSVGLYPVSVVRRINAIKAMMAEGMTLKEIRGSFLFLRGELDGLEQGTASFCAGLEKEIEALDPSPRQAAELEKELAGVRNDAASLIAQMERLASRIVATRLANETEANTREGT